MQDARVTKCLQWPRGWTPREEGLKVPSRGVEWHPDGMRALSAAFSVECREEG